MTKVRPPLTEPTPKLVTIPNVEICEVGEEWQLSTGPLTVKPDHIAKYLAGLDNDPAVHAPRLRFGHTDAWPVASEPAFGRFTNLRAENNGQTLVGDLAGCPAWFKEIAPAAWPTRSLDGWQDATTHTGNEYPLLISAVSFMGVTMPGINTLEDLAAVWAEEPPEGIAVEAGTPIHATRGGDTMPRQPVAAAVGINDLRTAFYTEFAQGDRYWWWIRETFLDPTMLIVDDDGDGTEEWSGLWAVQYTANASGIEFSDPAPVFIQYVYNEGGQVAAAAAAAVGATLVPGSTPAAVYANAEESRPQDRTKEENVGTKAKAKPKGKGAAASTLEVSRDDLIKRLKLADDATDEDITKALAEESAADEENDDDAPEAPESEDTDTDDDEDAPEGDPAEASGDLTMTVDKGAWEDTQRRLAAHDKRAAAAERTRRDGVVNAAVKEGRITRAHAPAWRKKLDTETEGTETLLTASEDKGGLPKNMVPTQPVGADEGDPATASAANDGAQQAYYDTHFPELANRA